MAEKQCWVCSHDELTLKKPADFDSLTSDDFKVTDAGYGKTAAIYRCASCGFLQCPEIDDVLSFYESMEDQGYEDSREPREVQMNKLLSEMELEQGRGRSFLDIGAGSGVLVEQAGLKGFAAKGVEPSKWLQNEAVSRGLDVKRGVLPMPEAGNNFDVVTLVDVIEHVTDPVGILKQIREVMADDGIGCVVTPDVGSLAAKIMGKRWWHFRIAHIGYFNVATLDKALSEAGLQRVSLKRPRWYFQLDYLLDRLFIYLPAKIRPSAPKFLSRFTIPLNLFDSLLVTFKKA